MKITEIKRGKWYQTTHGIGRVESVGGTRPPSVQITITRPIPRGKITVSPRDVQHEVEDPTGNQIGGSS